MRKQPDRTGRIAGALVVCLVALLSFTACKEQVQSPEDTAGEKVRSATEQASLSNSPERIARYLALALQAPGLRRQLKTSMESSSVTESKLHLQRFLKGSGRILISGMARAGGVSEHQITTLLEALPSMELYFPVPEHRRIWNGDEDLLIAVALSETRAPTGFTLYGERQSLELRSPPAIPTIVLVPAESFTPSGTPRAHAVQKTLPPTSNDLVTCDMIPVGHHSCGGGGGGGGGGSGWSPPADAVWERGIGIRESISHMRTTNDHEPWHKGAPEFYLNLVGTNDTDSDAELTKTIWIDEGIWAGSDDDDNADWRLYDPNLKLIDWDTDYGTRVRVKCMESDTDWNGSVTVSGNTDIFGVSVSFETSVEVGDSDDNCGEDYITPRVSTGEWTYIPDGTLVGPSPEYDGTSELHWYGYGIDITG